MRGWWIGGGMALAGIALMRLVADPLPAGRTRTILVLLATTIALAGLFVIAWGVKRRIDRARDAAGMEDPGDG